MALSNLRELFREMWTADVIVRIVSAKLRTEAHELQDIEQITDTYQKLYKCATLGMKDRFLSIVEDETNNNEDALSQLSPHKNTLLHVAVTFGHQNLASEIVRLHKHLLSKQNSQGDTALHIAARAGNYNMLKCLVDLAKAGEATDIEDENRLLFGIKNEEENTALHEAIIFRHQSMAHCLMEADPFVSLYANKEHKSPLYLAAEAGFTILVQEIVKKSESLMNVELEGKSPLFALILSKKKEMLQVLEEIPHKLCTIKLKDEKGRTPLHFAASKGYLEGVRFILKKFSSDSYQPDNNGTFPIHSASSKDHVDIVKELLQHCPASKELLNSDGQNILHVAAKYGRYKIVKYFIRKGDEFQMLINQKDNDGNTPLHLATIHRDPRVVKYLASDKLTNLNLLNKREMTALDVSESTMDAISSFHGRLTWVALKSANAERAHHVHVLQRNRQSSPEAVADVTTKSDEDVAKIINMCRADSIQLGLPNKESDKDRVNTLLVVTTLVATVTFAAGLTVPGGYNSKHNAGKATLLTKSVFQVFVISNTLAFYSSLFVAITLIWAQLGDIILVFAGLRLAMPLLGIAVTALSFAFMAGVSVVVSNLSWLAILVLVIGGSFLSIGMAIFIPLFLTFISPTFRYFTYYPFYLAALLASRWYINEPDDD